MSLAPLLHPHPIRHPRAETGGTVSLDPRSRCSFAAWAFEQEARHRSKSGVAKRDYEQSPHPESIVLAPDDLLLSVAKQR